MNEPSVVYSAGDCPVCADTGALLLLKATGSRKLLIYCPLCGVAWREPPPAWALEEVLALAELAPDGVALPATAEALGTGYELTEVPLEDWMPLLKGVLR